MIGQVSLEDKKFCLRMGLNKMKLKAELILSYIDEMLRDLDKFNKISFDKEEFEKLIEIEKEIGKIGSY